MRSRTKTRTIIMMKRTDKLLVFETADNVLQLEGSSLISPQSLSRSQTHRCGIQMSFWQWNSSGLQLRGAHDCSSSPCMQFHLPSQRRFDGTHIRRWTARFDGQSNVSAGHGIVSKQKHPFTVPVNLHHAFQYRQSPLFTVYSIHGCRQEAVQRD